jgi:hypothetical protein
VGDAARVRIVLGEQDVPDWRGRLGELAAAIRAVGLDHVAGGDHISFADGHGINGLTQVAALVTAHPTIRVQTAVHLLVLRDPAAVARQLATISLLAPQCSAPAGSQHHGGRPMDCPSSASSATPRAARPPTSRLGSKRTWTQDADASTSCPQRAAMPPSTLRTWPVTKLLPGPSR